MKVTAPSEHAATRLPLLVQIETLNRWLPVLVGLVVLAFYVATTQRTVGPYDSAELATGSATLGIVHAPGYPLYLVLGYLFSKLPLGEVAFRVNLMSGLFGALAVGALTAFLLKLTGHWLAATTAALAFGLSLPVWDRAVVAEVYTLQLFILAASWLLTLSLIETPSRWRLLALALVFGLTLAHRPQEMVLGAGLVLILWFSPARALIKRPPAIILAALGMLLGGLWYLYLPLRAARAPMLDYSRELQVDLSTLGGVWWMVSGSMFRHLVFAYSWREYLGELGSVVRLVWETWFGVGAVLGVAGIVWLARQRPNWALGLLAMALPLAIFYAGYRVPDKTEMFLPLLMVWSVCIAAGIVLLITLWRGAATRYGLYAGAGLWVAVLIVMNYSQVDKSRDWQAHDQAAAILDEVEPEAFVVADWAAATPLKYLQIVEGRRPDVQVFDYGLYGIGRLAYYRENRMPGPASQRFVERDVADVIIAAQASRPVYSAADYSILEDFFDLAPASGIYRVEPLRP